MSLLTIDRRDTTTINSPDVLSFSASQLGFKEFSELGLQIAIVPNIASFFFCSSLLTLQKAKTSSFNDCQYKKKIDRVSPGFDRVDRVSPGQFPSGFWPPPGLVPCPGRPGPGSTHRAGPGFKTLEHRSLSYGCRVNFCQSET